MIRARVGRLAAVTAAIVAVTVMSAGIVTAAPPKWVMTVTPLPDTVSPGAPAGYSVTITNNGPSNISALYLVDDKGDTPVYLTSSRPGACGEGGELTGRLFCSFGALNDDQSVTIVVGYTTPSSGSGFSLKFQANTTGATFSDVKGRSHGDLLTVPGATGFDSDKNFAGSFSIANGTAIANSAQLTGSNRQAAGLQDLPAGVPATVEDGPGTSGTCVNEPGLNCALIDGEWVEVNVAGGATLTQPFKVIIKYKQSGTPTAFFHSYGAGLQEKVELCPAGGPVAPCFTWDSSSNTATIYTLHNGSYVKIR